MLKQDGSCPNRDVKWPVAVPPPRAQALIFKLCSTIAMVKRILVIVSSKSTAQPPNWYSVFSGCKLASGEAIEVDQAE
jgi:hypothetical protein